MPSCSLDVVCYGRSLGLLEINDIENTGKEWLLHALEPLPDIERAMLLMTLWLC